MLKLQFAAAAFLLAVLPITAPVHADPVALDTTHTSTIGVTVTSNGAFNDSDTISSLPDTSPVTTSDTSTLDSSTATPALATTGFSLTAAQTAITPGAADAASLDLFFIPGPNASFTATVSMTSSTIVGNDFTVSLTDTNGIGPGFEDIATDTNSADFPPASNPLTAGDIYEFQITATLNGPPIQSISTDAPAPLTLTGNADITFTQVPEPTGAALLLLAATQLLRRARRHASPV